MKRLSILLSVLVLSTGLLFADVIEDLNNAFKNGSYRDLAKYFNNTIELNIPGNEGQFSKAQAEQILKEFFYKNQARGFQSLHQGESKEGSKYTMGSLTTTTGTYRTYVQLKKVGESYFIKELRIEVNN